MRIVQLVDHDASTSAKIFVDFGFNCYQFTVGHNSGTDSDAVEVIWSSAEFDSGNDRPSGSGIPLLFPFPGRLAGDTFSWDGKTYPMESTDALGNGIHGFVHNRPWRLIDQSQSHITGQFQASVDDPSLLERWPADFKITATYRLVGTRLKLEVEIENPSDTVLPCGLGTHPYFRLPLGGEPSLDNAEQCVVRLPVQRVWELIDMLPSGQVLDVENAIDLQTGVQAGELQYDDVFTDLVWHEGVAEASIADPNSGRRVTIQFNDAFPHCVVYNPDHREAVCIEPYSCAPNAYQLDESKTPTGWQLLQPGEKWNLWMTINVD
jgi:aldose 1-epimerase